MQEQSQVQDIEVIETRVIPLKVGSILREGTRIKDARSSVTLIDAGEKKILVDTGMLGEEGILLDSLYARGLEPEDIDFVVNTHLHLDHCGCNLLFRNSVFYADRNENPPAYFQPTDDGKELVRGVSFLRTPGHTEGSITVLARTDEGIYAVVGDAIPTKENYDSMSPPAINIDERLAMESMKRIISKADFIIPGHGALFRISRGDLRN
jgi:glyoxylase-like metal-dependent hydrolase (beta-lactamase superfamily II)